MSAGFKGHRLSDWLRIHGWLSLPDFGTPYDLLKLKEFLSSLSNVQKIELLPYHDMGKFKWKELGFKYPLENVRVANSDDVDRAKKILGI